MPPTLPPSNLQPYPTVGRVLSYARTYALDAAGPNGLSGDLLSASVATTAVYLNSAWERLQDDLIDAGVETLIKEVIIPGVPPAYSSDPSVSPWLTWDGYCDGQVMVETPPLPSEQTPSLPNDLVIPSILWQRQTGSQMPFSEVPAKDGGLPQNTNNQLLRAWEWRDDKLFLTPFTSPLDLKLRYISYYPDLADIAAVTAETPLDETVQVPIMRCTRALAYLLAADFAGPRDGTAAESLGANAELEIKRITNRTARRKATVQYRRQAFGR
jgi:hypothetical protein